MPPQTMSCRTLVHCAVAKCSLLKNPNRTRHKKRLKEKAHNFYRTDIVPKVRCVILFHPKKTHDILIYRIITSYIIAYIYSFMPRHEDEKRRDGTGPLRGRPPLGRHRSSPAKNPWKEMKFWDFSVHLSQIFILLYILILYLGDS